MSDTALAIALNLSPSQFRNAQGIITAVKRRGWSARAAVIAVEVALVESGMRILASANVPASRGYPHDLLAWTSDGLGHDHASMGMFQQQTGYAWTPANRGRPVAPWAASMQQSTMDSPNGWGTPAELMNPETSTAKFLDKLAQQNWQTGDRWVIAQNVQGSAYDGSPRSSNNWVVVYGGNYQAQDGRAIDIVTAMWPVTYLPTRHASEADVKIVQDAHTKVRYILIPGFRPKAVTLAGAKAYAALWGLSTNFPVVSHATLTGWDAQMAKIGGTK